jgi:hypothetical protein
MHYHVQYSAQGVARHSGEVTGMRESANSCRSKAGPLFLVAQLFLSSAWADGKLPPVRLNVDPEHETITAGESVRVKIELRDAANKDAAALQDTTVQVVVSTQSDTVDKRQVKIGRGHDDESITLRFPQPGIYLIKATHPLLREGAVHLRVKPSPGGTSRPRARMDGRWSLMPVLWAPEPAAPSGRLPVEVALHYSNEGARLVGNGLEACVIKAYLSEPTPVELRLRLTTNRGNIDPNPIVIAPGKDEGQANLTATEAGDVRVQYVGSTPHGAVTITEGREKLVHFYPEIAELRLTLSPARVSLGAPAGVEVALVDRNGKTIATEEDREVYLRVIEGTGSFGTAVLKIARNSYAARSEFNPVVPGTMKLSAETLGAQTREPIVLLVILPAMALLGTTLGGVAGGLLAGFRTTPVSRWKLIYSVLAGIAAAFLLYSACQNGLIPKLAPSATVSLFGATLIGLVGGWAGTEVFHSVLKLLGMVNVTKPA